LGNEVPHVEQGIAERSITDTWRRVACALAAVEAVDARAALQPSVDNSISKTISVPEDCPFDEFSRIYDLAYDLQLKGCTTFCPNPVTGKILNARDPGLQAPHCCTVDREAD